MLENVEDEIVLAAGLLTCSKQKLQHLRQLFIQSEHQINYDKLFLKSRQVSSQVYQHLSSFHITEGGFKNLLSRLKSYQAVCDKQVQLLSSEIFAVSRTLKENDIKSLMLLKGAAVAQHYRSGTVRNFDDVDVLVPDLSTGLDLIHLLKTRSYSIDKVRLISLSNLQEEISDRIPDHIAGIAITFRSEAGLYEGHSASFDVCISTFPGYNNWMLDCPIWERADTHPQFPNILVPSPEDSALILLIHALRHGRLSVRDINDLYVILSCEPSFDWGYFIQYLGENQLIPIASLFIQKVVELYEWSLPPCVEPLLRLSWQEQLSCFFLRRFNHPKNENLNLGSFPLQFLYNRDRYQAKTGNTWTSYFSALKSIFDMLRYERPYPTWSGRILQPFPHTAHRMVMIPIVPQQDGMQWQVESIDLTKANHIAMRLKVRSHLIGTSLLFWHWQSDKELILTPKGIYVQSSYDGTLSKQERSKLAADAASTLKLLQQEVAASAFPLPACKGEVPDEESISGIADI